MRKAMKLITWNPLCKVCEGVMLPQAWPYTVPSHLLVPLQSTCVICPLCHHLPSLSHPFVSPCCCCLPLSLSPPLLSIPVGGDVAVSTCSTLWVNAHSGGGWVLGHCHSCCLLPMSSLTTCPPCKLGLPAVVVSLPSPLVIIIPPNPPHEQWLVAVVGCAVIIGAIPLWKGKRSSGSL